MKNSVSLKNIKKSFNGLSVLDGFSAEITENTAFMGRSGNGKTTLARIIMNLTDADSGEVTFGREPKFSAVFQEDRLFEDFSAIENVTAVCGRGMSRVDAKKQAVELLDELLIDEKERKKAVRSYSGGMKRRVAIARALLSDSNILILDETFKGLDEETREQTASVIRKYAMGKLVILITHDIHEAELLGIEHVIALE